jgi:FkbM family methyltransferase
MNGSKKTPKVNDTRDFFADTFLDRYIRDTYYSNYDFKGIMVEVGAGPEEFYSNSKHWRLNGWRTICIDPNSKFVKQHEQNDSEIYQYACSNKNENLVPFHIVDSGIWPEEIEGISHSSLVIRTVVHESTFPTKEIQCNTITLNTLLQNLQIEHVDILSIDVEGFELEVLQGFNVEKYNPKIIMIESWNGKSDAIDYLMTFDMYKFDCKISDNYVFVNKQ